SIEVSAIEAAYVPHWYGWRRFLFYLLLKRRFAVGGARTPQIATFCRPPVMENPSHVVPVRVGDPVHCKAVTDSLLNHYRVYVLPINDPTVPRGTERMRFTPTPVHSDAQISDL